MKKILLICLVLGLVAGAALAVRAQEKPAAAMKMSAIAQTPEWQAIKSLAGNWEGTAADAAGTKTPATVEIRLTGGGSAVMHLMGKDTPYEMVTMFHPDGNRLLATHYCAAHNQPRMALVKTERIINGVPQVENRPQAPTRIQFEFVDGTNIRPGDVYMKRLVLTIKDADHHDETWTSMSDGKETPPMTFSYTRKK